MINSPITVNPNIPFKKVFQRSIFKDEIFVNGVDTKMYWFVICAFALFCFCLDLMFLLLLQRLHVGQSSRARVLEFMMRMTWRLENLLDDSTAQMSRGRSQLRPDVSTKNIFFRESKFSGKFSEINIKEILTHLYPREVQQICLPLLNFGRVISIGDNSQFTLIFFLVWSFRFPREKAILIV